MRKILVISIILALSACSSVSKLSVDSIAVDKPKLNLATPDPVILQPFPANVIVSGAKSGTFGNTDDVLKKDGGMAFALSGESYANLLVDMAKLQAYISQMNSQNSALKTYYEGP